MTKFDSSKNSVSNSVWYSVKCVKNDFLDISVERPTEICSRRTIIWQSHITVSPANDSVLKFYFCFTIFFFLHSSFPSICWLSAFKSFWPLRVFLSVSAFILLKVETGSMGIYATRATAQKGSTFITSQPSLELSASVKVGVKSLTRSLCCWQRVPEVNHHCYFLPRDFLKPLERLCSISTSVKEPKVTEKQSLPWRHI